MTTELIIQFAMILMPVAVGYIFIELVVRAVKDPAKLTTYESTHRAVTRMLSGVSIGIAYHMLATTLANNLLRELGSSRTVQLWQVEGTFLAMVLPAVFLLARESRRMKARSKPVAQ